MATTLSKRHQARNEKALQELIKTVPGNDRCADCGARNPGWASWSLGIFLCMRCASLHRKLGTHISKVKSLSMDSWSNDQVDIMKRNGNTNTNRTFNPHNSKPPIPLDVDEVDAVLERFIRQKYDQQLFSGGQRRPAARNDTGSTRSSDDQPPPLPPKPGKRFGFGLRSASSALPLQRNLPATPPHSPSSVNAFSGPPSPLRVNKQSRVFGASVGGGGEIDSKLAQLKDMGFNDERRNAQVLSVSNGNLERAIESLVRLGEGSAPASRSRTPNAQRNVAFSQPLPPLSNSQTTGPVNGISFVTNGAVSQTSTGSQGHQSYQNTVQPNVQSSRNFTSPDSHQSQQYQSQPQPQPQPQTSNQTQSYNPFETSNQTKSDVPLESVFQGMQISQQPLFPNATGGYPSQPLQPHDLRYQTMTPPMPQVPQQYLQNMSVAQESVIPSQNHSTLYLTSQQTTSGPYNPHASNVPSQVLQPRNNPFEQQHMSQSSSIYPLSDIPHAYSPHVQEGSIQQQSFQPQLFQQHPQNPQNQYSNPYAPQISSILITQQLPNQQYNHTQSQDLQTFNQYQPQPQPLQPQPTGRVDKSSILALYNHPQLAPPLLTTDQHSTPPIDQTAAHLPTGAKPAQRSATMPVQLSSGSRNPFQTTTTASTKVNGHTPDAFRHASQESVDVGGYQNGRHSPDAFASLSARFVR